MDDEEQNALFNSCIDSLESCMDIVNKYSDVKDNQIKYLKEVLGKDYCTIDLEHKKSIDAIKKVEEYVKSTDVDFTVDVIKLYESYLEKDKSSTDPLTHPVWYRIAKNEANTSVQLVEDTENQEENVEYETLDGSLMCSQTKSEVVDPLTKAAIKKPCKNKKCGHIYDFETICMHIKRKKKKGATCPYLGCTEIIAMSDLIEIEN